MSPQKLVGATTANAWIESLKPSANHGSDEPLSVVGGGQQRRALFEVALPAVPAGADLLKATFTLHLEANADVGLSPRSLELHWLEQAVDEKRVTWTNWDNGNRKWNLPGGDFGPVLAEATLPSGTSDGALSFDVTQTIQDALAAQLATLPLIVLEASAPPAAPAELSLTSRLGLASAAPALILQYCEP